MSHDEDHVLSTSEKLVMMANQIATFFLSQPHDEAAAGVANHINKFWEPRMRRQFFEMIDAGGKGFKPLVIEAASRIRRPAPEERPAAARASAAAH
ncbi:formate dehydrogenase subunit delta [Mesorhizobium sp. SP-1A]|jgi:formate dehydrogenase subunit delta|uniref:formate dehydrogenase subunit delta n=1 Tax=Mesorhizobium sp. SP-1A TaxID=3077840 RepID=UPI0028F6E874|nr:formate dehydrogenase subunit delta [Mesorhizobium sp. SP-1A]